MDYYLQFILSLFLINVIYLAGKVWAALKFGLHEKEVYLGFGKIPAFTFMLHGVKFYFGLFIPLPFLSRMYRYENGKKSRLRMEWEFSEYPIGPRLLTSFSGMLAMVIGSILVFIIVELATEESYVSVDEINKHGLYPNEYAQELGFKVGDRVVSINGEPVQKFADLVW